MQNLDMAHIEPESTTDMSLYQLNSVARRPRILLAASGSVAAIKFANLCHCFSEWAEVKAVATQASLHFVDSVALPKDVILYTDDDEWSSWKKIGDNVLHIELRKWADIMVIAPLSANTLAKCWIGDEKPTPNPILVLVGDGLKPTLLKYFLITVAFHSLSIIFN